MFQVRYYALAAALLVAATPVRFDAQSAGKGAPSSAAALRSRSEFDRVARVYYTGRGTPMPHVMFAIDRAEHDRVYYINSKQFRFHKEFVNATYLSLERGDAFYAKNYSNRDRRFLLGTLAYQVPLARYTFEFYESDDVDPDMVRLAARRLGETFFAPLTY